MKLELPNITILSPQKIIILFFIIYILRYFSCSLYRSSTPKSIRIQGSDTMLILCMRWAEEYMKTNPSVVVYSDGGGTEKGVEALIKGKVDICAASRPLRPEEVKSLAEKYRNIGIKFLVAKDALSIYVNPNNPVQNIKLQDVKRIFTGEITNWKQLNGRDEPVLVFIRPPNSGTHLYFKEHILEGKPYSHTAQIIPTTPLMVKAVLENKNAIGYGGLAYGTNVVHSKIDGIEPTIKNVRNDTYPIIRYLHLYTTVSPQGEVKSFIDWTVKDGQKIVREVGYIPLWEIQ